MKFVEFNLDAMLYYNMHKRGSLSNAFIHKANSISNKTQRTDMSSNIQTPRDSVSSKTTINPNKRTSLSNRRQKSISEFEPNDRGLDVDKRFNVYDNYNNRKLTDPTTNDKDELITKINEIKEDFSNLNNKNQSMISQSTLLSNKQMPFKDNIEKEVRRNSHKTYNRIVPDRYREKLYNKPNQNVLKRASLLNAEYSNLNKTGKDMMTPKLNFLPVARLKTTEVLDLTENDVRLLQNKLQESVKGLLGQEKQKSDCMKGHKKSGEINLKVNVKLEIGGVNQTKQTQQKKTLLKSGNFKKEKALQKNTQLNKALGQSYKTTNKSSTSIQDPAKCKNKTPSNAMIKTMGDSMKHIKPKSTSTYYVSSMVKALKNKLMLNGKKDCYYNELYFQHFKNTYMHFNELQRLVKSRYLVNKQKATKGLCISEDSECNILVLDLDETLVFCAMEKKSYDAIKVKIDGYNCPVN